MATWVWTGAIAVIVSWAMTGCRWGNYIENGPATTNYWETQPVGLNFAVHIMPASGNTTMAVTNLGLEPSFTRGFITNPIRLTQNQLGDGPAGLFPINGDGSSYILTSLTADSLDYVDPSRGLTVYSTPHCDLSIPITTNGTLIPSSGPFSSGYTGGPLSGRMTMTFTVEYKFTSSSTDASQSCGQLIANCINDQSANACGQGNQNDNLSYQGFYTALYAPFIAAGVMVSTDIPNIDYMNYQAYYK